MKTLLDLVIRLAELAYFENKWGQSCQITENEKASLFCLQNLIRDSIPSDVLRQYEETTESEPEMLKNPEVFAMAVLVATYKNATPARRKKLVGYFDLPGGAAARTRTAGGARKTSRGGILRQGRARALAE